MEETDDLFLHKEVCVKATRTVQGWRTLITKALKDANKFNSSLKMQIESLAVTMYQLDLASKELETLDRVTCIDLTRYGEKLSPHPVFKILKDLQDSITRQMKILSLTPEDLTADIEASPLERMTDEMRSTAGITIKVNDE